MVKTSVKFQKNRNKTVGGVALIRYPLSIHFYYQNAQQMTKFKLRKKSEKINLRSISKPHAHLQSMVKTSVKFQKYPKKLEEELRTQDTHCLFTYIIKYPKKKLSSNCEKRVKINLRTISKPHAHLQSMMKTSVKFQKNWNKTAGGVAHTRYILL